MTVEGQSVAEKLVDKLTAEVTGREGDIVDYNEAYIFRARAVICVLAFVLARALGTPLAAALIPIGGWGLQGFFQAVIRDLQQHHNPSNRTLPPFVIIGYTTPFPRRV
jgi:hypothetical protein